MGADGGPEDAVGEVAQGGGADGLLDGQGEDQALAEAVLDQQGAFCDGLDGVLDRKSVV